jgi:hypothetical protein
MTYNRPGVYISETLTPAPVPVSGSAYAAGAAIGAFPKGPTTLTLVTSWSDFASKFGSFDNTKPATFGVNQFFVNGGSELYVKRVLGTGAAAAAVSIPDNASGSLGTATAVNKGADGNNLRIQITGTKTTNYYNITVLQEINTAYLGTASTDGSNDIIVEQFTNVVFNSATSADYAQTVVNATSQYIVLALSTTGTPAVQTITTVLPLISGSDGSAPTAAQYAAVVATDGTSDFDTVDRPLVIFAPEIYAKFVADAVGTPATSLATVHDALIAWANTGTGFAVIDTAPGLAVGTSSGAIAYVSARTPSSQAAAYFPHYYTVDPTARSSAAVRKTAPASAIAGLYLATDKSDGPYKSPAGTNTNIRSAVSLERGFTPADLDSLNTGVYYVTSTLTYGTSVNAIRQLPGSGIVVMGARTLLQDGTANRYVSTRRSLLYVKKQLQNITQFAMFQNNDQRLWDQLQGRIGFFLNEYRLQGGLKGASPADAYYIKVNSSNNTAASIATGVVNIQVGVALQYPAEFVVINLSQITGN